MNKIGFKNFRRFLEFEPIELGKINFFVGKNNSGKSTLVKAILLLNDFLDTKKINFFSFGNKVLEDANIVTYGRAINKRSKENFIEFFLSYDEYEIIIKIFAADENKTQALVDNFTILDTRNSFKYIFKNGFLTIQSFKEDTIVLNQSGELSDLEKKIKELKKTIKNSPLKKSDKEYLELINDLQILQKKKKDIVKGFQPESEEGTDLASEQKTDKDFSIDVEINEIEDIEQIVLDAIDEIIYQYEDERKKSYREENVSEWFEDYKAFYQSKHLISRSFKEFLIKIESKNYYYLGANPSKQSALFSIRDKNNSLAQAIHDYHELRIDRGEYPHLFINRWMRIFEIGYDFTIQMWAGEAYEIKIKSILDDAEEVHLADKGMGSLQIMLMLFKIASIIKKNENSDKKSIVIIEEPELNLHPGLQSELANFFITVHKNYKIDFIVETHSEYILRKSQVIVAEGDYAYDLGENPFCVYYFPKDPSLKYYRLNYQEDGTFDKDFGIGFFDEASKSTMQILRLRRQNRKHD